MKTPQPLKKTLLACLLTLAAHTANADAPANPAGDLDVRRLVPYDARSDLLLSWDRSLASGKLDIHASLDPRAGGDGMLLIASGIPAADMAWSTTAFDNVRPYFFITRTGSDDVIARGASRLLPLEGGRNFRDMGGYPAADGRTVKWGMLYRSGVMHQLTDADYAYLDDLDIHVVCDYRSTEERSSEPTDWRAEGTRYVSWDYADDNSSALMALFRSDEITAEKSRQAMTDLYPGLLEAHQDRFRTMFEHLLAGDIPLTFNCSAGKDRTGVSAGLLLSALGVPRDIILHDYSLSDDYVDYMAEYSGELQDPDGPYAFLAQLPPGVLAPLMASDPRYLANVLDELDHEYGSVLNYLKQEMGLSDADIRKLRNTLTQ